ncbi:vacuole membrane protein 1-like [Solea solea]|uniref:vacuole membrane protein 1-like n=1 Tax=Solea solea TaxID=90069 RepID=UPI00272D26A9|nr:vacuole membrane protein 1-like [Solea solea]
MCVRGEERREEQSGRISVPLLGAALQKPFREHLEAQKAKLHHHAVEGIPTEEDWMSWLFEKVVVMMVCFFVCSIVNFMAQSFAKRRTRQSDSSAINFRSSHHSFPHHCSASWLIPHHYMKLNISPHLVSLLLL